MPPWQIESGFFGAELLEQGVLLLRASVSPSGNEGGDSTHPAGRREDEADD